MKMHVVSNWAPIDWYIPDTLCDIYYDFSSSILKVKTVI